MKNIMYSLLILLLAESVLAQEEKVVESKITDVTVFLNKAQITRQVKTRVEGGKTNLVISGLTAQLDAESIQVSGKGNFVLLGISHQQNFLNDHETPLHIQILNDSVQHLQRLIAFENAQKQILDKEEQMLLNNQKIGGADQNLPVAELKAMADFFRKRLSEIAVARLKHDEKIRQLNRRLSKVQQQIQQEQGQARKNTSEVVVAVSADSQTNVELVLSYVVGNAGWHALYDLRAMNAHSPMTLLYRASVFQSTGENWKNVRLKLSTANPTLGGVKPDLSVWHLDFYQREYYDKYPKARAHDGQQAPSQALSESEISVNAGNVADFVTVNQTVLNTEFDISLPYTVNSASKPTTVDIGRHELKANYRYAVAPKLDQDAFLMAGTTAWMDLNLLPGNANVFFEGTFVGKTYINPQTIRDTLYVSLGRDKRIVVKREKVKDFTSQAIIGLNRKEAHAFEINVRNNQSATVTLVVEDQIPLSRNSQIEIALLDRGGADFTPETGKLTWKITLKPGESKRLLYQFEVKFPKDKLIAGLN